MSEELGTSKDLISDLISEVKESELKNGVPARIIWPENLKQAAIKIKKKINEWHKKGRLHKEFEKLSGFKRLNVDTFMKWFFNLTEEDLR